MNYRHWTAAHRRAGSNQYGRRYPGKDDTIIVTFYRDHEELNPQK